MTFSHALAALWPKSKYFKAVKSRLIILLILSAYVLVNSSSRSFAQSRQDSEAGAEVSVIRALQIGDQVPEEFWNQLHLFSKNGHLVKESLNAHRGKLLVIDFWASWCAPCLSAFPVMDSLSAQYDGLQFIKATYEEVAVKAASSSIIQDTLLSQYFAHRIIPHYAWISPTGRVLAFTAKDGLNAEHIEKMLIGERASILTKFDLDFSKPIFLHMPDSVRVLDMYSAFHKGLYKGLPSGFHYRASNGRTVGMSIMNQPLKGIYRKLARQLLLGLDSNFMHNPFIVEVSDPNNAEFDAPVSRDNVLYTYDIELSEDKSSQLHQIVLDDINRHTPYQGSIEQREVPVFLLSKLKNTDARNYTKASQSGESHAGGSVRLKDNTAASLIRYLNAGAKMGRFIVDATGNSEIPLLAISGKASAQQIEASLNDHGLELVPSSAELTVFVVRDAADASSASLSKLSNQ